MCHYFTKFRKDINLYEKERHNGAEIFIRIFIIIHLSNKKYVLFIFLL